MQRSSERKVRYERRRVYTEASSHLVQQTSIWDEMIFHRKQVKVRCTAGALRNATKLKLD